MNEGTPVQEPNTTQKGSTIIVYTDHFFFIFFLFDKSGTP